MPRDPGVSEFKDQLVFAADDSLAPVELNIYLFLKFHPDWKNILGMDANNQTVICKSPLPWNHSFEGPLSGTDYTMAVCWLQHPSRGLVVTADQVKEVARVVAQSNEQPDTEGSIF